MGDNFNSNGGPITVAKDSSLIIQQNSFQSSFEDLLKILNEAQAQTSNLPEPVRSRVHEEIQDVQLEVQRNPQDKEKIADKVNKAKDTLKAIAETVPQAVKVGNLLGNALIWLDKIF